MKENLLHLYGVSVWAYTLNLTWMVTPDFKIYLFIPSFYTNVFMQKYTCKSYGNYCHSPISSTGIVCNSSCLPSCVAVSESSHSRICWTLLFSVFFSESSGKCQCFSIIYKIGRASAQARDLSCSSNNVLWQCTLDFLWFLYFSYPNFSDYFKAPEITSEWVHLSNQGSFSFSNI